MAQIVVQYGAIWRTFQPKLKNWKNPPWESFIYLKIELSRSNIKKFLIFSLKRAVLIFQETQTSKKFLIFSQKKVLLIFGKTKTLQKFLIFQETKTLKDFLYSGNRTFQARKKKKNDSEKIPYILVGGTF